MIRSNRLLATIITATVATSALGTLLYAQTAPAPTPPAPVAPTPPVTPPANPADDNKAKATLLVEKANELLQSDKIMDAKTTNDAALKLAPDLLAAKVMDAKIKLRIAAMAGPTTNAANTQPAGGGDTASGGVKDKLTNAQINRMKAYETTAADKTLQGTVDQSTLNDFWTQVIMADPKGRSVDAKDKQAFLTAGFAEQVRAFKESGRNDYIDKLKFGAGDPATMKAFKEINTWVVFSCTYQPGCHAMDNSNQAFRVYTKGGETPANVYTNFYLMQKVSYNKMDLIDRERPESSLLAQFGLPVEQATISHPGNKKIPPRFAGLKDAAYIKLISNLDALRVIGSAPDYGFGGAAPTTAPATTTTPTTPAATTPSK